ncbi:hypothetical protein VTI74DRAFT_2243 [Chaetomium olivicolor]
MAGNSTLAADHVPDSPHKRHCCRSPSPRHNGNRGLAPRRPIRSLLFLVALVNLAWSLYQLPVSRVVESRLCREHYAGRDPSPLRSDGSVPEELCKIDEVQQPLGKIQGVMEALWVAGDFLMTIPLVSLADHYGHRFVLCLNLIPRVFLLAWTFAVGYFDRVLPINAILAAPILSFLGGDCVFNSIVYSLVSELTDDHVLRATFFGYVNAVSAIFSLQLGPALASATMSALLWLPFWIGIAILLIAVPVISTLPLPSSHHLPTSDDSSEAALPLLSSPSARHTLKTLTKSRLNTIISLLSNPSRNFVLLLAVFFFASLASSDTKMLTLYISKRYGWKFSSVGYLLSGKAVFNFILLSVVVPRVLQLRQSRRASLPGAEAGRAGGGGIGAAAAAAATAAAEAASGGQRRSSSEQGLHGTAVDKETIANAHICLVFSVLGALAIALSPAIWALVPSLLLYALGIALPMFTWSLLKSPSMGLDESLGGDDRQGTQLFSVVMLVKTVGTLLGAVVMPALWVAGLGIRGWALGMPFLVSAGCYAIAGGLVRKIAV